MDRLAVHTSDRGRRHIVSTIFVQRGSWWAAPNTPQGVWSPVVFLGGPEKRRVRGSDCDSVSGCRHRSGALEQRSIAYVGPHGPFRRTAP